MGSKGCENLDCRCLCTDRITGCMYIIYMSVHVLTYRRSNVSTLQSVYLNVII